MQSPAFSSSQQRKAVCNHHLSPLAAWIPALRPFFARIKGKHPLPLLPILPILVVLLAGAIPSPAQADPTLRTNFPLDFSLFRLGSGNPVVLVIGGIQGDEPGGFSAATLLATRYHITEGTVWVVPNLNFPSIIRRSRGVHGDMNRKFAVLDDKDPEFPTVTRIQELIRAPEVSLVLNLHDGSGFYRPKRENNMRNPARWGQCVIIDQTQMDADIPLRQLGKVADEVTRGVNGRLLAPDHRMFVRNTRTADGDKEMEKSLSWFAVRHNKAAFGLEASKEFPVEIRAYYHLNMIEHFLRMAGVKAQRDFELTPAGLRAALQSGLSVAFAGNRIMLPLEDVRPAINLLPLPRGDHSAIASKPIMAVLPDDDKLCVYYGNRTMTRITPDWRDMDHGLDGMRVEVDGEARHISFGQIVQVRESFTVAPVEHYRVNAIGAELDSHDESGHALRPRHFKPRFSVDRQGTLFRVEVYRGQKFAGLFLVRFGKESALLTKRDSLPDAPNSTKKESALGF